MSCFQELCRVRVVWLRPGELCLRSKLGLNEHGRRDICAVFDAPNDVVASPPAKSQLVAAMLSAGNRALLEGTASQDDPFVELQVPATVYEFDPAGTDEGWLEAGMLDHGAETFFRPHMTELGRVADWLAEQGRVSERPPWGRSVCFHTLWVFRLGPDLQPDRLHPDFAGYVDLSRVPFAVFAEKPSPQLPDTAIPLWGEVID